MVRPLLRCGLFGGLSPGANPPGAHRSQERSPGARGACERRRAGRLRRRRLAAFFSVLAAFALCAVASCALFVPGLALGAGTPAAAPTAGATLKSDATSATMATAAALETPAAISTGSLLVTLPWGSENGQVGLQAPAEGLVRGPEALAVAPDGRIAILDSVNKRVVMLDAGGAVLASAPLALAEPRFLAVNDERLCVLDCDADRGLVALDWTGAGQSSVTLPELGDVVTGLFLTDLGPCVEVGHDGVFLVQPGADNPQGAATSATITAGLSAASSDPAGSGQPLIRPLAGRPVDAKLDRTVKVSFKPGKNPQLKLFKVDDKSLQAAQTTDVSLSLASGRAIEHLVSVDGDGGGGIIVGAHLLSTGRRTPGQPSLWLARLAPGAGIGTARTGPAGDRAAGPSAAGAGSAGVDASGEIAPTDTLLLNDSSFAYLGQPYVVAPDGRVYQPVGDSSGYSILVHSFASRVSADPEGVK
jgi:hypothetical protein